MSAPDALQTAADANCFLKEGTVSCEGANQFAQIGPRAGADPNELVEVPLPFDVTSLAFKAAGACATSGFNRVSCWGVEFNGQPPGATYEHQPPTDVVGFAGATIDEIGTGVVHGCDGRSDRFPSTTLRTGR